MAQNFKYENGIISRPKLEFELSSGGLGFMLFQALKKNKDRVGQYIAKTKESKTFGEILQMSIRAAVRIKAMGFENGSVICINAINHRYTFIPILASLFNNYKIFTLHPSLSRQSTEHLITLMKPKLFFSDPEGVEFIEAGLRKLNMKAEVVVFEQHQGLQNFEDFIKPVEGEEQFEPIHVTDLKQTIAILCSSGTTGLPKGVGMSHYALLGRLSYNTSDGSAPILCNSAPYWFSAVAFFMMSVLSGQPSLCSENDPKKFWKMLEDYKPYFWFTTPYESLRVIEEKPTNFDKNPILLILLGGKGLSASNALKLKKAFPGSDFIQTYGLTEVSGLATGFDISNPEERLLSEKKAGSCGRVSNGVQIKIVDVKTGQICGFNQNGEILIKSEYVMNGYVGQDSPIDSEGWLKTGDIGYYDEDFCFYIVGRIKEIFKYKMYVVSPAEIEEVISQHPSVDQVAVIGVPHGIDGDVPAAVVSPKENSLITEAEIHKLVDENLTDKEKLRGGVRFMKELPMTPSGKINKFLIGNLLQNNFIN